MKIVLATLACLALAGGCDRSEGRRLVGAWEGVPQESVAGRAEEDIALRSCRFEFEESGGMQITLRLAEGAEEVEQARWQVVEVGIDLLTVEVKLPDAADNGPRSTLLEIDFDGDDRFIATEVEGDYRVPPLVFDRQKP